MQTDTTNSSPMRTAHANKPVHITFFAHLAYGLFCPSSPAPIGGAEVQLYQLAKGLSKDPRYKIHFIVGNFGQAAREDYDGIDVWRVFPPQITSIVGKISNLFLFLRVLRRIPTDLIIASGLYGSNLSYVYLGSLLKRCPYLYRLSTDKCCKREYYESLTGLNRLDRRGFRKAAAHIVQTEQQRLTLEQELGIQGTVVWSAFPVPADGPEKKKTILWVGRAIPEKQPEVFLRLCRQIPDRQFVMVMPPPATGENRLYRDIAEQAKSLPNLDFVPGVPFEQVNRYFAKAKVFVNTSSREGFPNTFIQAGMHRVPILSLQFDPDDILNREGLGYCAKGDENVLVDYLREILDNQDLWSKRSKKVYEYMVSRHSVQAMADKYRALIEKLVK